MVEGLEQTYQPEKKDIKSRTNESESATEAALTTWLNESAELLSKPSDRHPLSQDKEKAEVSVDPDTKAIKVKTEAATIIKKRDGTVNYESNKGTGINATKDQTGNISICDQITGAQLDWNSEHKTAEIRDAKGNLEFTVNGEEGKVEHQLTSNRTLTQLKGTESLTLDDFQKDFEQQTNQKREQILINGNGDQALISREGNTSLGILSNHNSEQIIIGIDNHMIAVRDGKAFDIKHDPNSAMEITDWKNYNGIEFHDGQFSKNGQAILDVSKDGQITIGETTLNSKTGELRTVSNSGEVTASSSEGHSTVKNKDIADITVYDNGRIENRESKTSQFTNYDPDNGLEGRSSDGTTYNINNKTNDLKINDHGQETTINNDGRISVINNHGREIFHLNTDNSFYLDGIFYHRLIPGNDTDTSKESQTASGKPANSVAAESIALAAAALSIRVTDPAAIEGQLGLLAYYCSVLGNAAQQATVNGNLSVASLCTNSLSNVLATANILNSQRNTGGLNA